MRGFGTTREYCTGIPVPVQSPSTSLLKSPFISLLKESSSVSASTDANCTRAPIRSPSTSLPKECSSIPASAVANCTQALARSPPTSLLKECSSAFSPTDANCTPAPVRSPFTPPPKECPSVSAPTDANCTPAAGEPQSPSTSFTQESPSVFSHLEGSSVLLPAKDAPISSSSSLAPASSVSLTARDSSEVERREKNTEWGRQFVAIGKKATYGSLMAIQMLEGVKKASKGQKRAFVREGGMAILADYISCNGLLRRMQESQREKLDKEELDRRLTMLMEATLETLLNLLDKEVTQSIKRREDQDLEAALRTIATRSYIPVFQKLQAQYIYSLYYEEIDCLDSD
uniref:Uncharacterized protein n=1 Tax=Chromera velia CCMP2878 TaxID=1169474 RepID=A0A0G4HXP6_9ALVE|eukprot:Cvel_33220.t1-p1 / transcript=Cvel_33220.t1 / gene=Cvel_33220 / organism=Chromera_velia_CCMP2878 / gene_product=hypothetical protein / transcript_product=hypothetical protein / location=Cvel_scaffold5343:785-1813(-) / protein_length=343 / sequence_SO=supercontig / SO=protein_coding / is_pseudo=false